MKKKLIPFIFGLSMLSAIPFTASADDEISASGNVTYEGGFVTTQSSSVDQTELVTAVPEYIVTIPRDTSIKRGARIATIGHAAVTGNYFIKPYGVEVSLTKVDFTNQNGGSNPDTIAFAVEDTSASTGNNAYITANGTTRKKCRYYKNNNSTTVYDRGDIAEINQSRDVVLKINDSEWQNKAGGIYKGSITFSAQLCDDVTGGDWVAVT